MLEFALNNSVPIIIAQSRENYIVHKLNDIVPFEFSKNNLIW